MGTYCNGFYYSPKYKDDKYEYRHVILPSEVASRVPKGKLLTEDQWRHLGVQQSRGWVHYTCHKPEPHILMFRRELAESEKGKGD
ncbi:Cyclin-dependent kinase, regulatory subunit like protein [Aduncisulcus paluster]|uniref:Cyclin-dependent kinases regulatory subunit n=1 Tax=Aduncisulcus paluster TaxID=2918883 RepID=A0ABQ5JZA2_9EUKA|nr:Cyclin-dependent kinase, regulatory subunit like protein [Aduncisulcus paluster]